MNHAETYKIILYTLLLALLSACTSITTSSSITSGDHPDDLKSIYIVYDDFVKKHNAIWNDDPDIAASAEVEVKKIASQSMTLWPKKFASHGIQTEITTTSSQKQLSHFSIVLIDPPKSDLDYDMLINLESVTPRWLGMFDVNFEVTLRNRKYITGESLWKAHIKLHKGLNSLNEQDLSNQMAEELLSQMKRNRLTK